MIVRSLRVRLLVGAALAILVALGLAGVGVRWLFERHIERRESLSLQGKAKELLAGLRLDAGGRPVLDSRPTDARFGDIAGGLYWQVSTSQGQLHSPSLWDQSLPLPPEAPVEDWATRRVSGPYGDRLLVIGRIVRPDESHRPVLVQLATDDSVLRESQEEFDRELIASLALLWAVLLLAAYAQVVLGLRPLARIRDELDRLRRSPAARLSSDHPAEVRPLIEAINALADARATDLERARRRAADLAHSLKTPLAALSAQSRRAREAGAADAADGLDRAIASAGAALETELARARSAAARDADRSARASVIHIVEGVLAVVERTEAGERIAFEVAVAPDLSVAVAPSDLAEILGALIENAVRFARRQVRIAGEAEDGGVTLTVSDDGPGIAAGRAEAALVRGGRLDEAGPGHGFGLAIVNDLVQATDGALSLTSGALGGLEVTLRWQDR